MKLKDVFILGQKMEIQDVHANMCPRKKLCMDFKAMQSYAWILHQNQLVFQFSFSTF